MFDLASISKLGEKAAEFMALISGRVDKLESVLNRVLTLVEVVEALTREAKADRLIAQQEASALKSVMVAMVPELGAQFNGEHTGDMTAAQVFASLGAPLPDGAFAMPLTATDEADLHDAESLIREQQKPTELATAIVSDFDKANEA